MAGQICEWAALNFDPNPQKLHEVLDVPQRTTKKAFGSEAQQFKEKDSQSGIPGRQTI